MVSRVFAMAFWSMTPSRITRIGLPHSIPRNPTEWSDHSEIKSSSASRVRMGITPESRGIPMSCMGTAARSEIKMATTSSEGSSSPICRFPMTRTVTTITRYSTMVRKNEINITISPKSVWPLFCWIYKKSPQTIDKAPVRGTIKANIATALKKRRIRERFSDRGGVRAPGDFSIRAISELTGRTGTSAALRRLRCPVGQIRVVPREVFSRPCFSGAVFLTPSQEHLEDFL